MSRQIATNAGRPAPLVFEGEDSGDFSLGIKIYKDWEGLPGKLLRFRCRMYLSNSLASRREGTVGLKQDERSAALIDFRMLILADVLLEPPMMKDKAAPDKDENWTVVPRFPEEVAIIGGTNSRELQDRAYAYLAATDARGQKIFYFLVDDVVNEYWRRAVPRDYFPEAPSSGAADSKVPSKTEGTTPGL